MMTHAGRFAGKVVVVTGAAQGIGRTVALRVAREGGRLALIDRSELVHDVRDEAKASGADAIAITADLETFEGASAALQTALSRIRPDRRADQQCRGHHLGEALCGV